jgi:[ribosomal protein S18]-alanine N-acetyltransferase
MHSKLRIRQMELDDIPALSEIENSSFHLPYSVGIWEKEKRNSLSRTLVVVEEKGKGAMELKGYLNFWLILDEAEIHRIAVKKEYRRSGIAAMLLREMFRVLRDMKIVSVHLEVRQSNNEAINLYEKLGFMLKGRRQGYYEETGEDALILEADLKRIAQT